MKKSEKMKVLKSVNLHLEYIGVLGSKCKKKVEHTLTSKKITYIPPDTLRMKKWENSSLIIIT